MQTKTVDITPDKTLVKKLGLTGYRTEQAISELIDNSIDARLDGETEQVDVNLDFDLGRIIVSDNGCGMDLDELQNAMTIAKEPKKTDRLGRFGLGMKSACSSLGKRFTIETARAGEDTLIATYDEDEWLDKESMKWENFEIGWERTDAGSSNHGTRITINNLNVSLYPNQMIKFRRRFGLRYGPYIKNGQVSITVNSRPCMFTEPDVSEGTKRDIRIRLPSGNSITGWIGLLKKRSIRGDYGLHIYNRGRLIEAYSKFGIRQHPSTARFMGIINLDHVPVNFHKTGFLADSDEYVEAVEYFGRDQNVAGLLHDMFPVDSTDDDDICRVLEFDQNSSDTTPLDMRVGSSRSRRMLYGMDGRMVKAGNLDIEIVRSANSKDTLYETESTPRTTNVRVNVSHRMFDTFRNPLFLLGLIRIETEVFAAKNIPQDAIRERNRRWHGFVSAFLPAEKPLAVKRIGPRQSVIPLPYYAISPRLVDLHDYLQDTFPHRFQFTGLSTLDSFLHNCHHTAVYTIQAETGTGQELQETIIRYKRQYKVLLNPSPDLLAAYLEGAKDEFLLVIRERSERLAHTWAPPEKAWIDMYTEVEYGSAPYSDELTYVLDDLLEKGLVSSAKIRSMAKRRSSKIMERVNRFLPE